MKLLVLGLSLVFSFLSYSQDYYGTLSMPAVSFSQQSETIIKRIQTAEESFDLGTSLGKAESCQYLGFVHWSYTNFRVTSIQRLGLEEKLFEELDTTNKALAELCKVNASLESSVLKELTNKFKTDLVKILAPLQGNTSFTNSFSFDLKASLYDDLASKASEMNYSTVDSKISRHEFCYKSGEFVSMFNFHYKFITSNENLAFNYNFVANLFNQFSDIYCSSDEVTTQQEIEYKALLASITKNIKFAKTMWPTIESDFTQMNCPDLRDTYKNCVDGNRNSVRMEFTFSHSPTNGDRLYSLNVFDNRATCMGCGGSNRKFNLVTDNIPHQYNLNSPYTTTSSCNQRRLAMTATGGFGTVDLQFAHNGNTLGVSLIDNRGTTTFICRK